MQTDQTEAGERTQTPTLFEKAVAELENLQRKVQSLRRAAEVAEDVAIRFTGFSPDPVCYVTIPCVIIRLYGVKDLKDVVPVLAHIIASGFRPETHYDDADNKRRCYTYRDPNGADLTVFAHLATEGAACSFKQVGVKEQPIYELVCSDDGNGGAK